MVILKVEGRYGAIKAENTRGAKQMKFSNQHAKRIKKRVSSLMSIQEL